MECMQCGGILNHRCYCPRCGYKEDVCSLSGGTPPDPTTAGVKDNGTQTKEEE